MLDIRNTILNRLKELGWTRYRLAKEMQPHLSRQGVYQYLNGSGYTSVQNLQRMLDVLGLMVATAIVEKPCGNPEPAPKRRKKPAKSRRRVAD